MKHIILAALLCVPMTVGAHPYISVTTDVEVLQTSTTATAVRITWTYDAQFSAAILGELGFDAQAPLSDDAMDQINTFVTDWPDGFDGDLYLSDARNSDTQRLPDERLDHVLHVIDGQLVETFTRPLPPENPLTIENYDPFYVTDYSIETATVTGDGTCSAQIIKADLVAAQAKLDALIAQMPEGTQEMDFPAVGRDFADAVLVTCD